MFQSHPLTLLIADDEQAIRSGLANAVDWKKNNIQVLGLAKDGNETLKMIEEYHPDLVITDIRMPGCSGLEMIEQVRKKKLDVRFIILSGYEDFSFAQQAIRNGVNSYLLKPVKVETLLEEVERIRTDIEEERRSGEQNVAIHTVAHAAEPVVRQRFYAMLAQGEYHSVAEIENGAEAFSTPLIQCPSIAATFRFTLPLESDSNQFSRDDRYLFRTALRNVAEELADGKYHLECFLDEKNEVGILLSPVDGVVDFLTKCIETMKSVSSAQIITTGLGVEAQQILDIPASCRTSEEMAEYHLYQSSIKVFEAEKFAQQESVSAPRPPATQKMAEAVAANEEKVIKDELDRFFSLIMYIPMPPPRYVRGMCIYLLNDVSKRAAMLLQCEATQSFRSFNREVERIASIDDLKNYMRDSLCLLAASLQSEKKAFVPESIELAKTYIQKNVLSRLRVEDVAAYVHLSESYFSALFKKCVGITAGDYIFQCKIEKAKLLLREKSMTVLEIAEALEYSDYRSFSRAFKRFAGHSPTEYQQLITSPKKKG